MIRRRLRECCARPVRECYARPQVENAPLQALETCDEISIVPYEMRVGKER